MRKFVFSLVFLLLFLLSATAMAFQINCIQSPGMAIFSGSGNTPAQITIYNAETMKVIDVVTFKPEGGSFLATSTKEIYPIDILFSLGASVAETPAGNMPPSTVKNLVLPTTSTVYITNTGGKYHSGGCSYLRKSKIPISLAEAKTQGYEPCSRCNPPR